MTENYQQDGYDLYKQIYMEKHPAEMFLETPSSHLIGMKYYLQELREEYPNILNIPYYIKEERLTYWERIAGFYNPQTNELDDDVRHQLEHQGTDEKLADGWVRFYIFDANHNRCCFLSAVTEDIAIKGYKYLKNHYKSLGIHYFQIDWIGGNATYDGDGKEAKYDEIYEFFRKHLLNSSILYENPIYDVKGLL